MTGIGQVDGQQRELLMAHQDEEEYQADEGPDQQQQPKEESLRRANAVDASGTRLLSHSHRPPGEHHLQPVLQVLVVHPARVAADVLPHHIQHHRPDQRVLDDERIQIRGRVVDNRSHNIDASTGGGVECTNVGGQGRRIDIVEALQILEADQAGGLLVTKVRVRLEAILHGSLAEEVVHDAGARALSAALRAEAAGKKGVQSRTRTRTRTGGRCRTEPVDWRGGAGEDSL